MGGKGSGRPQAPCGTRAAYLRHRKNGQNCTTCKQANTLYYANKRKLKPKVVRAPKKGDVNRQMVRKFKLDAGGCMDCGMEVNDRTIVCFDLDHRDPQQKSFTISYMIDKASPNDIRDELEKCDVVCRNCHALRTYDGQHHLVRRDEVTTHLSLFD